MDRNAGQIGAGRAGGSLYPAIEPFERRILDRGDGHRLYVEQSGNPKGRAVVVLHGGPGGGSSPYMRRFFDPDHYRIVLFDQRGCGHSRPTASITDNTTAHLISDIEAIREVCGITQWALFGGSWGATLALAYAQAYPSRVTAMVLRGVFLGMADELRWFYGGDPDGSAARFFPDLWQDFCAPIPEAERDDLIGAYHRRLFCGDWRTEADVALPWVQWENALAGLAGHAPAHIPPDYARTFARLECHYFHNRCFLEEGQLLRGLGRIAHIPASIVHGRYDMVCPPLSAWRLAQGWPRADLRLVPASGHALSEPRIASELVRVMDDMRDAARGG